MQALREELMALMTRVLKSSDVPLLEPEGLEDYADKIARRASVLTYHDDGQLRGFIAFYCNDADTKIGFITMLMVDPAFRRKGLASVLMQAAIEAIRARGFGCCRLKVKTANFAAISFYERAGFVRTGTAGAEHSYELRLAAKT
jgi:ribosomal protein S18 acetylase RimI-like enzyme